MRYKVNKKGFFGEFGGAWIPEMMYPILRSSGIIILKLSGIMSTI
jgi:hypothetical protein